MINIIQTYHDFFLQGMGITLLVALVGTIGGIILGMLIYFLRALKIHFTDSTFVKVIKKIFSFIAVVYIDIMRGTPMIVQAVIFYYSLASPILHWNVIGTAFFIVSFNTAAYIAEIVRSGVNALGEGQIEAGQSLGMSRFQIMRYIIFPQALKNSVPSLMNELIVNIKDSAVLNVIGLPELFYQGMNAGSINYQYTAVFIIIAIIYFVITFILSRLVTYIVNRKGDKRIEFEIQSTTV